MYKINLDDISSVRLGMGLLAEVTTSTEAGLSTRFSSANNIFGDFDTSKIVYFDTKPPVITILDTTFFGALTELGEKKLVFASSDAFRVAFKVRQAFRIDVTV